MTKSEAITQLVPQTHNPVSEAMLWLAAFAVCGFALYMGLGWLICWIDDKWLTRKVKRVGVR